MMTNHPATDPAVATLDAQVSPEVLRTALLLDEADPALVDRLVAGYSNALRRLDGRSLERFVLELYRQCSRQGLTETAMRLLSWPSEHDHLNEQEG